MVVDTLSLQVQVEELLIVLNLECELLVHLTSCVGSEHHVHRLPLARLKCALGRSDLEPFTFSCISRKLNVSHKLPDTWNFLLVLESDLDCLPSLDADLAEVDVL